jgi:hypothetical protein
MKKVWIDAELVWDYWSLMFCCLKMDNPHFNNSNYAQILYKKPETFLTKNGLDMYHKNLHSVKPWIHGYSFFNYL